MPLEFQRELRDAGGFPFRSSGASAFGRRSEIASFSGVQDESSGQVREAAAQETRDA